jgi:hypothetical protein
MHKDWYITLVQGSEKLEGKTPLIECYWYGVTDKLVTHAFGVGLSSESKIYKEKICTYNWFLSKSLTFILF